MRSSKLVPALIAAAALVCLAPAVAAARRVHPAHVGRGICRVHIEVPSAPISAGETVTILGSLSCARKPEEAAGKPITIFQQSAGPGGGGFLALPAVTTEANGSFKVATFALNTNSVFYAVAQGAKSAHRAVKVTAPITVMPPTPAEGAQLLTGVGRGARVRNAVIFAGKVSPLDAGALVVLQRENSTADEEWHRIGAGTVNTNGEYSITHAFRVPGDASIRVVVHPLHVNAPAATTPLSYEISQQQKHGLEILSSTNPLSYGQPVMLHGSALAATPGTPITLLARPHGQHAFTPVATTPAGGGGSYSFMQAPLQNTLYKVAVGKTTSAILFEGVKYALNVNPTPTSAVQGQPLSFSGSVVPALVGHAVYLEHLGAAGLGWNIVDIGTVGAPAKAGEPAPFTIVHAFFGAKAYRLRLKVPGDPGNQGIASAQFEVNVAPAPAAALTPEAPGNSKLPGEGQL